MTMIAPQTSDEILVIARAAGWDAGNRSMQAGNRTTWNREDYDAACHSMECVCYSWGYAQVCKREAREAEKG